MPIRIRTMARAKGSVRFLPVSKKCSHPTPKQGVPARAENAPGGTGLRLRAAISMALQYACDYTGPMSIACRIPLLAALVLSAASFQARRRGPLPMRCRVSTAGSACLGSAAEPERRGASPSPPRMAKASCGSRAPTPMSGFQGWCATTSSSPAGTRNGIVSRNRSRAGQHLQLEVLDEHDRLGVDDPAVADLPRALRRASSPAPRCPPPLPRPAALRHAVGRPCSRP